MALSEAETSEKEELLRALKACDYIMAGTAAALGIHETTVQRRIRRYGLDALVEKHNPRVRALRTNRELPPAPHECSRQALEQKRNREAGLCGCGRPIDPDMLYDRQSESKSCANCRARWRDRKRKTA
jgi:hypothetical protein